LANKHQDWHKLLKKGVLRESEFKIGRINGDQETTIIRNSVIKNHYKNSRKPQIYSSLGKRFQIEKGSGLLECQKPLLDTGAR